MTTDPINFPDRDTQRHTPFTCVYVSEKKERKEEKETFELVLQPIELQDKRIRMNKRKLFCSKCKILITHHLSSLLRLSQHSNSVEGEEKHAKLRTITRTMKWVLGQRIDIKRVFGDNRKSPFLQGIDRKERNGLAILLSKI